MYESEVWESDEDVRGKQKSLVENKQSKVFWNSEVRVVLILATKQVGNTKLLSFVFQKE